MTNKSHAHHVPVAWVRTQIPDTCRQNAHVIAQERNVTLEEVYRYILTFALWGEPSEALEFWDHMLPPQEVDRGT